MLPASDLLFSTSTGELAIPVGSDKRSPHSLSTTSSRIVVTLGPPSQSVDMIEQLIQAGANVFRLNFSHGDHDSHARVLENVRIAARNLSRPVAILQDLCGPKIRLTDVANALNQELRPGQKLQMGVKGRNSPAGQWDLATDYEAILTDVRPGNAILINDGKLRLRVIGKQPDCLDVEVEIGGEVSIGKGINLPHSHLSMPSVTQKDWDDLAWGIRNQVDFVALSFVRQAADLIQVRDHLERAGCVSQLLAKIERPEALSDLDEILDWCDGLMVARGDLALETNYAEVPLLQKRLIQSCRERNKTVITATQMLDSMVNHPCPTRAEVSDIANAVLDGTDALMLSNESAAGRYPVQAVSTMKEICQATEATATRSLSQQPLPCNSRMGAMAQAAATLADRTDAAAVVVYTQSGYAARHLSRLRMPRPVIACTNLTVTQRQLALSFGVHPILVEPLMDRECFLQQLMAIGKENHWWRTGDSVVFLCSESGCTGDINCLQVVSAE